MAAGQSGVAACVAAAAMRGVGMVGLVLHMAGLLVLAEIGAQLGDGRELLVVGRLLRRHGGLVAGLGGAASSPLATAPASPRLRGRAGRGLGRDDDVIVALGAAGVRRRGLEEREEASGRGATADWAWHTIRKRSEVGGPCGAQAGTPNSAPAVVDEHPAGDVVAQRRPGVRRSLDVLRGSAAARCTPRRSPRCGCAASRGRASSAVAPTRRNSRSTPSFTLPIARSVASLAISSATSSMPCSSAISFSLRPSQPKTQRACMPGGQRARRRCPCRRPCRTTPGRAPRPPASRAARSPAWRR